MDNIGLTKTVKEDACKFKVFLDGRKKIYTIQALNLQQKQQWVSEIQRHLLEIFDDLKRVEIKQYINAFGLQV